MVFKLTVCFNVLGNLYLPMVVRFKLKPFLPLPQLPLKLKFASKMVNIDSKIIFSLSKILNCEIQCTIKQEHNDYPQDRLSGRC